MRERKACVAILPAASPDDTVEVRLARWRAAGAAGDRRLQQRAVIVAILLFCGFVIAFGLVLHAR
jgi:hypothetical protein